MALAFDFESIKSRIISSLSASQSWATMLSYSSTVKLVEAFAQEEALMMNKDTFDTRETKWGLAKNTTSLLTQAPILSYQAHRKIGATGIITLSPSSTFNGSHGVTIPIPAYTVVSDSENSNIKFCTITTDSIGPSDLTKDFTVVQGIPRTISFIAQGLSYEEFSIIDNSIENSHYTVTRNGVVINQTNNILLNSSTDNVYELVNAIDFSGVTLRFGNGIFGQKLSSGDTIVFSYIDTLGSSGNVSKTGVVSKVESTILDINSSSVNIYCTNNSILDGGSDYEDKESIRANAPQVFQTGDSATRYADYKVLLEKNTIAPIYKCTVWGEYEYLIDNNFIPGTFDAFVPVQEDLVYISAFDNTGNTLSSNAKANVIAYLNTVKSPTDVIFFQDPEFVYIIVNSKVYVKDRTFVLNTVYDNVITLLSNTYSLGKFNFGTNIYDSDYKYLVDSVDGVDHNYTTLSLYNYFTFTQATSAAFNLSLYPVAFSTAAVTSVRLYIQAPSSNTWTYIGQDSISNATTNGDYTFTGANGYDLTRSSINYSNGTGYIYVSYNGQSFLNYSLKIVYNITSVDYKLLKRNQIFRLIGGLNSPDINVSCVYAS